MTHLMKEGEGGAWTWLDIHGCVRIRVRRGCPAERQLVDMFRPFLAEAPETSETVESGADITVDNEGAELRDPSHGEHAYRFTDTAVDVLADRVRVEAADGRFTVRGKGELLTAVLPLVDRVAVLRGTAMVHAATVAVGDVGVCLPAWGGVGKTSTVAKLAAVPGGAFMGDDWSFVDRDHRLLGYAKPMFLKPHHEPIYPEVFAKRSKPLAPSALTDTVARLATAVHPVIIRYPRLADVTRRWSPEHMMVHPGDVFPPERIATNVPLGLACFVERYDGAAPELVERDIDWMVTRVIGNFHAELPRTSRDLVVALGATGLVGIEDYFADKAAVLREALTGIPAWSLRVPVTMSASEASDAVCARVLELIGRDPAHV